MGLPKEPIELNLSNYNQYIPINIIAYSFASGGAQGEPGGVIIINNEGQLFHFNYVDGDIKQPEDVYLVCPPIKEKLTGIVQNQGEWNEINMGMGNCLIVNISIYEKVKAKIKELGISNGALYQKWTKIILEIIEK